MEAEFIRWLRLRIKPHPQVALGIGSDAAVLRWPGAQAVVTTDALMDGVDFVLAEVDPERVGRKSLAVNLSDLAAMGARPVAVFISLVLPRSNALALAQRLYEGMFPLAESLGVAIAGGDTNTWDGPLVISVTAIGEPPERGAWTRAGARPGDWILVTGSFGGSLLKRHLDFTPRVVEARHVAAHYDVHAATDVSDGLTLDLSHILTESDCGAILELEAIPVAADAVAMSQRPNDSRTPLEHALGDGEDFELVLVLSPEESHRLLDDRALSVPVRRIGEITARTGLWSRDGSGRDVPLTPRGYQH